MLFRFVAGGWWLWRYEAHGKYIQSTNDAYIQADAVVVAPKVAGYVAELFVADNQQVKAGQPLLRIDPRDYQAQTAQFQAQIDVANAHKYAVESLAAELLPVRDALEAALAAENASAEALRSGADLTLKQLTGVFEKANLKEINPVGEKFDPHRHQAISMLPSDREPNTVINVLQKGYLLADRVVRPALVTVAKGKD